jgi:hypothetical protein
MAELSPTSLSAGLALGVQKIKGTAATIYVTGLMAQSGGQPRFDRMDIRNEHGGTSGRATVRKARSIRMGYVEEIAGRFRLYPDLIGHGLRLAGFKCTTTAGATVTVAACVQTISVTATAGTMILSFDGQSTAAVEHDVSNADLQTALIALSNLAAGDVVVTGTPGATYTLTFGSAYLNKTPPLIQINTDSLTGGSATVALTTACEGDYYTHVCTLANRWFTGYGSVLMQLNESPYAWERKVTDCRLNRLQIAATLNDIMCEYAGLGLTEAAAAGTETKVAETAYPLSQAAGGFSLLAPSVELGTAPRENTLIIAQTLDDMDKKLHSTSRADVPVRGVEITGQARGLDCTYAVYKKLVWGGTSGTGPDMTLVEGVLDYNFQSPGHIGATSVHYKLQVAIANVELNLSPFQAVDDNMVRFDVDYAMQDVDPATAPITITLVNDTQHYAGT